ARLHAGQGAAVDVDDVGEPGGQELLARLAAPAARAAQDVQRLALRAVAGPHHRRRVEPVQRHVAGGGDVDLPVLDRRAHVDQVDLPVPPAKLGERLGADGRNAHGELLSVVESPSFWNLSLWAWAGAELGPQAPLSQVLTPKRGSTHAWRMTQATRTARGMRNSIVFAPFMLSPGESRLLFTGQITTLRHIRAKKLAAEAGLDTGHDVRQVRLGDPVVRLAPVLLAGEQAAALHEAQVLRGHVAGAAARLGQFPDRVA